MLYTFDPLNTTWTLGGILIAGFADGTWVNVEYNEDAFTLKVGASGSGTRNKSNNASGLVTFTLQHGSPTNDLLSALHQLDIATPNGDGIAPLLGKYHNGSTLVTAEKAWIKRMPGFELGKEEGDIEWTIETLNLISFIGGHS